MCFGCIFKLQTSLLFLVASKWWWKINMQITLYKRWLTFRSQHNVKHCCTRFDRTWTRCASTPTENILLQSLRSSHWSRVSVLLQLHQAHPQQLQHHQQKQWQRLLCLERFQPMESKLPPIDSSEGNNKNILTWRFSFRIFQKNKYVKLNVKVLCLVSRLSRQCRKVNEFKCWLIILYFQVTSSRRRLSLWLKLNFHKVLKWKGIWKSLRFQKKHHCWLNVNFYANLNEIKKKCWKVSKEWEKYLHKHCKHILNYSILISTVT